MLVGGILIDHSFRTRNEPEILEVSVEAGVSRAKGACSSEPCERDDMSVVRGALVSYANRFLRDLGIGNLEGSTASLPLTNPPCCQSHSAKFYAVFAAEDHSAILLAYPVYDRFKVRAGRSIEHL